MKHRGDEAQRVHRTKDDCDRANRGPTPAVLEDAGKDQEFAGERA